MKLKKIVTLVSSAILAFSLVGCSIEGEESSAGSDGAVVGNGSIGFSVSTSVSYTHLDVYKRQL